MYFQKLPPDDKKTLWVGECTMDHHQNVFSFLWYYAKQHLWGFAFTGFAMLVWAVNEALFPYFIKEIIEILATHDRLTSSWEIVWGPLGSLVGLWLTMDVFMRAQGAVAVRMMPKFCQKIRQDAFWQVTGHSQQFFVTHFSGNVANKINDLPRGAEYLVEQVLTDFIPILFMFSLSMILMGQVSLLFTLVTIVWFCLHVLVVSLNVKAVTHSASQLADATSQVSGKVVDALTNILSMRLFARRAHELSYFNLAQAEEAQRRGDARARVVFLNMLLGGLTFLLIAVTMGLLIYGWQEGWVSIGDFSLISMLVFSLVGLIWHLSFEMSSFFKEIGLIKAALSILRTPYAIEEKENAKDLEVKEGSITFDHVTFGYQGKEGALFKDLSLHIPAGQKVGLVGFSGSGKTSFANLIARAFDPQDGKILVDGGDIKEVRYESLARAIAFIPQDPTLFHRTLKENIRYGRLEASDDEVYSAATLAHADLFIKALKEGYDTSVGERGLKLSGGQRQRIAIARAALKNAPILILDEATSALDSVTERLIQDSLHEIMQGRTTLVIAHRLSTLQDMDRILVFDKGRIIEDGSCETLLAQKGVFYQLWQMQSEGFLPDSAI